MDLIESKTSPFQADLYFLFQQFLSASPLKNTLKVLTEELEQHKILPKRVDWTGQEHERTLEDMHRQFPYIRPDFLLQLCFRSLSSRTIANDIKISSFLHYKSKVSKTCTNFQQFYNYVIQHHGVPAHDVNSDFNIANCLRGREISGYVSRQRSITPKLYGALQIQRITLGHLSAVYCLLFDYSGKFIMTGADDLLIKLWSAISGRLIHSFRGASSEITDIAISLENTLLAAGSIDRILRVWNLQTGAPVAVLSGHTGTISSVNFCPTPCWGMQYLISTSSDGSIAFWTYNLDNGKAYFRSTPMMYQEKIRPGQSQMICSSFSVGGTFLATGSADHHVRVYYMKGDEGPHRILENEAHTDRVDSIQWAHSGLKFLSGSKDGTAIIWLFERQQWKNITLNMSTTISTAKKNNEDSKKLKVTMVAWNLSDKLVITAVSDYSLKVWNPNTGQLEKVLTSHTDEVYVLESHPLDTNVILSAGHDGQLFVWDLNKGEIVYRFLNTIEGQGFGAIFDVKWSPDGQVFSASDSHGHILTFGFGKGSIFYEQLPKELFFHTDYRPLVSDTNHYVLDEQTQVPPHLMPPPFLVDIDGNPYPPMLQRLVPGREHCKTEQLVPNIVIGNEGTQEVIQDIENPPVLSEDEVRNGSPIRLARSLSNRSRDAERIRNSTGDWQSDPNMKWQRNVLIPQLKQCFLTKAKFFRECMEEHEIEEYQKQLKLRPHMICTSTSNNMKSNEKKKNKNGKYPTRGKNLERNSNNNHIQGPPEDVTSSDNEELSDSSGYSDWMADEGVNLEPPKRSKRQQVHITIEEEDDDDDEEESEGEPGRSTTYSNRRKIRVDYSEKDPDISKPGTSLSTQRNLHKLSEQYRISEWLSETKPRKSPYFPQMGDEIVYFIEGHQLYLDAVRNKKAYEINSKDLPWNKFEIRDHEYVKVIGIQYEIKPPRLCCLRLVLLDEGGRLTGKIFTVKYHDMADVLDFLVLKQTFTTAMSRNWKCGDKFRCIIDDGWWIGEIIGQSPGSQQFPNSTFLCYEIRWQNGEQERMSPWDFEPIDENRMPPSEDLAMPVLEEELNAILYKPVPEDWPNNDRLNVSKHILNGLTNVMQLAIAEPFLVPVDLNIYPTYAMIVEYPTDLSTIKARFENNFYRRLTAAQFDIRYLATNAEKFNVRHSIIVKHARILTELCLRIVKNCTGYVDVQTIYHQLVDTYDSSDTEDEIEIGPSCSRSLRSLPSRSLKEANDWIIEAKNLLDAIWEAEDSIPFRTPVNATKYPDYKDIVKFPMDLTTVKENLFSNKYNTPEVFCKDMKLIFQNSRTYNTNKRSRIYVMTVRLAAIFDEHISKIIENWKIAKKLEKNSNFDEDTASSSSSSSSSMSSRSSGSDKIPLKMLCEPSASESESSKSSDTDDIPLKTLKTGANSRNNKHVSDDDQASSDSQDNYEPMNEYSKRRKKKYQSTSDEDEDLDEESSESSASDKPRRANLRRRQPQKRSLFVSSDSDEVNSVNTRSKRKRKYSSEDSDSDDKPLQSCESSETFVHNTVSSRGRVRRLTPRAMALMKNNY